jgi:hypothetical protein
VDWIKDAEDQSNHDDLSSSSALESFLSYFFASSRGIWCLLSTESRTLYLEKTLQIWKAIFTSIEKNFDVKKKSFLFQKIVENVLLDFSDSSKVSHDSEMHRSHDGICELFGLSAKFFHAYVENLLFSSSSSSGLKRFYSCCLS